MKMIVLHGAIPSPLSRPIPPDMENGILITEAGEGVRRVPNGVTSIDIEIWGAGGGGMHGGDTPVNPYGGSSGGGGAYCKRTVKEVSPGEQVSYTVGAGGQGDSVLEDGGDGGDSTCDGMTAGGGGGHGNSITGGEGGSAVGGDINQNGGNGAGAGFYAGGADGAAGGNSPNGGSGGAAKTTAGNGNDGTEPGGGGGGAKGGEGLGFFNGGNGANGGIRFSWSE